MPFQRGHLVAPDGCSACPLRACCEKVPPEGNTTADIVLVGMGPGNDEVQAGRPFVGRSGQLLNTLLSEAGIRRGDIFITNAALGLPRALQMPNGGTMPKAKCEKESILACRGRLLKELQLIKPKVIVAVGALPMEVLTDVHGMTRLVGSLVPLTADAGFDAIVIPSFHPAHLLRGEQRFYPVVLEVLKKARRLAARSPEPLGNLFVVDPTSPTLGADLNHLEHLVDDILKTGEDIAVDVETTMAAPRDCDLTVFGFGSLARKLGVAVTVRTWVTELGRFVQAWTERLWQRVNGIIARLLTGRNTKIYHNYGFDVSVLERFYIIGGRVRDTMILHHLAWPDCLHGLDTVAQYYLDIHPWKYYFRRGEKDGTGTHRDLLLYNATDCLATACIFPHALADATARGNLHIEGHQLAMADLARRAHLRGLPIDLTAWEQVYAEHLSKRDKAVAVLHDAIKGHPGALESFTVAMKRKRYSRAVAGGKVVDEADVLPVSASGLSKERREALRQGATLTVEDWNPNSNDHGAWFLYELLRLVPERFTSGGAEKDPDKKVPSASYKGVLGYMSDPRVKAYVDRAEEEAVLRRLRELRGKMDFDGVLRAQVNSASMKGTRWTYKPNCQNLDKTLKKIFRAHLGRFYIGADAAQLEYRLSAFLAGIDELLTLFNAPPYDENHPDEKWKKFSKDYDAHSLIAEEVFQDLFRRGDSKLKSALRTMVKRVVYALFYGAFPEKIYNTILEDHRVPSDFRKIVSLEYIERIHTGFCARFPQWDRWADQEMVKVRMTGKQSFPPFNRVRAWAMPWLVEVTKIRNTPIQLAAGDVVNVMFRKMDEEVRARGLDAYFVIHAHDACYWDVAAKDVPAMIELVNRHFDVWLSRVDSRTGKSYKIHIYGQADAAQVLTFGLGKVVGQAQPGSRVSFRRQVTGSEVVARLEPGGGLKIELPEDLHEVLVDGQVRGVVTPQDGSSLLLPPEWLSVPESLSI